MYHFKSSIFGKFQLFLGMVLMFGLFSSISAAVSPEFKLLLSFDEQAGHPIGKPVQDANGNTYSVTGYSGGQNLGAVFKIDASGIYTVIHLFDGINGSDPRSSLILGSDGNLYGTTYSGGDSDAGTIFQINISGSTPLHTVLYSFDGSSAGHPIAGVNMGSDGKLYGTTYLGGDYGIGTVYQLDISSTAPVFGVLHSFFGFDGGYPKAGVIQGKDGKFYGISTLPDGGNLFQIDISSGTPAYSSVHQFDSISGNLPAEDLIQGSDGKFYGTTQKGGNMGFGTVFQLDTSGATPSYTVLHNFDGGHGASPRAGLIQGSNGKLYGTAYYGGFYNAGTVFQVDMSGPAPIYTVLHEFDRTDGGYLDSGLIQGKDGNLYGTTYYAGITDQGTVFQIDISGTTPLLTVLHEFDGITGGLPGALILGSDGDLYGGTSEGGSFNGGVLYRIRMNNCTS